MAYWGYFAVMKNIVSYSKQPRVLEIGVDKGQTLIPMLHYLSLNYNKFTLIGCDILFREELNVKLNHMRGNLKEGQLLGTAEESSLEFLPRLIDANLDVIGSTDGLLSLALIDGDHNYYTVKRELEYVSKVLALYGIMVIDDYDGRWSEQDEYFSELEEYKERSLGIPNQHTEKKGVKTAVDEFLKENPDWTINHLFPQYEPVLVYRKDMWDITRYKEIDKQLESGIEQMGFTVSPGARFKALYYKEQEENK